MLNNRVRTLLNQQVNSEFYSAYLYHNMELQFMDLGLYGFAGWFRKQAGEEMDHATRIENYLLDNNEKVTLSPINSKTDLSNDVVTLLQLALEQEQRVTGEINAIYNCAMEYGDIRTMNFLNWFVGEQLEEEASATDNLQKARNFATCGGGLFLLDEQMGERNDD